MVKMLGHDLGQGGKAANTGVKKEGNTISKKIGWMNNNAYLNDKITYSEVVDVLSGLDEATAVGLLDELAQKGPQISNPTNWLKSAAGRGGKGGKPRSSGEEPDGKRHGAKKISTTVGWLNKFGELAAPIRYDEVAGALMTMGDSGAGRLLKELGEKKDTIKDPTSWLAAAAKRQSGVGILGGKGGKAGKGGIDMSMLVSLLGGKGNQWGAASRGGSYGSGKISKTVGWLNKHCEELQQPINFSEVVGPLTAMGEGPAGQLLNQFKDKAGEIKDPTKWLVAAASRKAQW